MTDLTITISIDTAAARREVEEFRAYAMGVIEEIRAAHASVAPGLQPGGGPPFPGDQSQTRRRQ